MRLACAGATLLLGLVSLGVTQGPPAPAPVKPALVLHDPRAFAGYTLISPMNSNWTYLIDLEGRVVKRWRGRFPAATTYLLENGHLLRVCAILHLESTFGGGPGATGLIEEITWDGEMVWDFTFQNEKQLPHHDVCKMPSGNVLLVVWEKKTPREALAAGRRPELVRDSYLLPDSVIEVQPTGRTTGKVVWEWHLWDHLIQDHDRSKANYGAVADHPERVDVNFTSDAPASLARTPDAAGTLRSIGYVASARAQQQPVNPDWTHINAVAYNPALDQIALTVHGFSEVWIIDHSTTTAEAAGSKGGRGGKGGDLLYRWGNPRAHRAGTLQDQQLFSPHHAHWIPPGHPGAGHLLIFNNGTCRPGGEHSSVDELVLPADDRGRYAHRPGTAFGPDRPLWSYTAPKKSDFYSMIISGAQRLPNGNTLICSGVSGTVFEVIPAKEIVWKYVNPARGGMILAAQPGGLAPGTFRAPPPGEVVPAFVEGLLQLKAEQKKQLALFQKEVDGRLDRLLSAGQRRQFRAMAGGRGSGLAGPGQVMTAFQQARLKLTAAQKKELAHLQQQVDRTLARLLDDAQKKRLEGLRTGFARGGFGRGADDSSGTGFTSLFRSYRYPADYPGLKGKELKPGKTVEELELAEPGRGQQP